MWELFPRLLYVCTGDDDEEQGGFGYEYLNEIIVVLKKYVSRDPERMKLYGLNM